MTRRFMLFLAAAAMGTSAAHSQVNPDTIQWGPPPPGVPAGAQFALLSGDPAKPGIFVFRVKLPAGYVVPPHHHGNDEYVTVIDGSLTLNMGTVVERPATPNLVAGGFIMTAKGMNHYVYTRTGATLQVSGQGPFSIIYVNPADDPRNAGAAERGQ